MSRLTSTAPFNKPSAFDVPPPRPAPLSPPETEMESALVMPQEPRQDPNSMSPDAAAQHAPTMTDSPTTHFRRISNLAYSTSSLSRREPRPPHKQSRWLVMVLPPASLTREPPMLGHTLSSAPAGRFANGILMPLFPTLYAQLTAIAREFNMPSTAGLCIYLQVSDPGASMLTPRISDETWQLLWGHFFAGDDRAAQLPPHGLPISGRIEFDIDMRRAKWFDTWMGHSRRERGESDLSREPSVVPTHWRAGSRTSLFAAELPAEESPPPEANPPMTGLSSRTIIQRQVPRPLLLERRDVASVRSFSRHTSRAPSISHELSSPDAPAPAAVVPAEVTLLAKALSPVAQEEEPQTARKLDLQTKVHEWRQSSSVTGVARNALTAAGQPSLDPVNMPSGTDVELDLNDFAWSISSAGPPSESPVSVDWSEPLPSVHLLGRLQGSVCLTPSVATSFGPLDYDWPESPVSCVSRRPSPDLGLRMMDYVPLTPTTATSWGPDNSASHTESEFEFENRAPSVDIGVRGMGSRPVTPSTATSWGPPDSPLSLPLSPQRVQTPDVGERAFPHFEDRARAVRALVFPYYTAWQTQPWGHVWPYQTHRRRESAPIVLSAPRRRTQSKTLLPEWPDFAALYPSDPTVERAAANKSLPVELPRELGYPVLEIYPAVYPYSLDDIYPDRRLRSKALCPELPGFARPYKPDPTVERAAANKSLPVGLHRELGYPVLEIYPAVYPYSLDDIYPDRRLRSKSLRPELPDFAGPYKSDPTVERAVANKSLPVELPRNLGYPVLDLYPPVYPYNLDDIYPASSEMQGLQSHGPQDRKVQKDSPLPEFPDFASLYPSDSRVERAAENKSQPVLLLGIVGYPFLEIYPTAYPYTLDQIYPVNLSATKHAEQSSVRSSGGTTPGKKHLPEWPDFASLYPADHKTERAAANKSLPVTLQRAEGYPYIVLYDTVYPHHLEDIYPPIQPAPSAVVMPQRPVANKSARRTTSRLLSEYPDFAGLYPSDPMVERAADNKSQPVSLPASGYPFLSVYPSVYPWNLAEIYGPEYPLDVDTVAPNEVVSASSGISVNLPVHSGYPIFDLYPANNGYPNFEIYPSVTSRPMEVAIPSSKLTPGYPALQIYEPVYPKLVIYPQTQVNVTEDGISPKSNSPRKRAPTPGPGRRRSHGTKPPTPGSEPNQAHRLSRSPIQKDLAVPPLPVVTKDVSSPRRARLTHLDLHRRVFGADSQPSFSGDNESPPLPRRRKTHDELHRVVHSDSFPDSSQGHDDFVPELPRRAYPPSTAPVRQRSSSGTTSSGVSTDLSHNGSRQSIGSITGLQRSSSPAPIRQRSRSGTVSSRVSADLSPPTRLGGGRWSSVSKIVSVPPSETSTSSDSLQLSPYTGSPSVTESPPPFGEGKTLSQARLMTNSVPPVSTISRASNVNGIDPPNSQSSAPRRGANRQSIVLERSKAFMSEDMEVSDSFSVN